MDPRMYDPTRPHPDLTGHPAYFRIERHEEELLDDVDAAFHADELPSPATDARLAHVQAALAYIHAVERERAFGEGRPTPLRTAAWGADFDPQWKLHVAQTDAWRACRRLGLDVPFLLVSADEVETVLWAERAETRADGPNASLATDTLGEGFTQTGAAVTVDSGADAPSAADRPPVRRALAKSRGEALHRRLGAAGIKDHYSYVSAILGREVRSLGSLDAREAALVGDVTARAEVAGAR